MATKKAPNLAVGRGEKLPVSKGAGLTAKGEPSTMQLQVLILKLHNPKVVHARNHFALECQGCRGL